MQASTAALACMQFYPDDQLLDYSDASIRVVEQILTDFTDADSVVQPDAQLQATIFALGPTWAR